MTIKGFKGGRNNGKLLFFVRDEIQGIKPAMHALHPIIIPQFAVGRLEVLHVVHQGRRMQEQPVQLKESTCYPHG